MSCQREHDGVTVPEHLTADDLAKIIANQNQQIEELKIENEQLKQDLSLCRTRVTQLANDTMDLYEELTMLKPRQ